MLNLYLLTILLPFLPDFLPFLPIRLRFMGYGSACFVNGQDEPNNLSPWRYLACSGQPDVSRMKNFPQSHIINPLLAKPVWSRWLDIEPSSFLASLWTHWRGSFSLVFIDLCGRCTDFMVGALDSGARGPGSSSDRGHCFVFWARHFTLIVPLATQVYKWVPANFNTWGNPAMGWLPIQGGVEILLVASCYWNRDKLRPDRPLDSYADFTLLYL